MASLDVLHRYICVYMFHIYTYTCVNDSVCKYACICRYTRHGAIHVSIADHSSQAVPVIRVGPLSFKH